MSIITDGMAQVHCELPWQANLATFPEKLTQHFQGVLEHGVENLAYFVHSKTLVRVAT